MNSSLPVFTTGVDPAPPTAAITPVLLCGGSGTRLWPLSRKTYPKQFANFLGDHSLFQACVRRLTGPSFAPPIVVTTDAFRFLVAEQLAQVQMAPAALLVEPEARDTAPAILAATLKAAAEDPSALVLVAPTDHVIPDAAHFQAAVAAAVPAALAGRIVTFGIRPDRPETGYGYLELETPLVPGSLPNALPLRAFVEKPATTVAQTMLEGGRHLWNAGLFLFRADTLISAARELAPDVLGPVGEALAKAQVDMSFERLDATAWARAPAKSIDYALMERAQHLSVMPYEGRWSDLGDWASVLRETQQNGNATSGHATAIDCEGTLLRSESSEQLVVGIGLTNIVAIAMPDAVLVAHRDRVQEVKAAVATLKVQGAAQAENFPRDHRPWGWFDSLARGDRFQVKRIVVHPGAALSLQSHHHRSEHWIVVEGTARVTLDDDVRLVSENQSIYIPLGARHRLENPGKLPMVLIEVQTGPYLGEDDIVRYQDTYARN